MKRRKFCIATITSIIIFIIGFIMVNNNFGRLSILGMSGYTLCIISMIMLLSTFVTKIVLRNEEKRA